jgi:hypothetical protein
MNLSLDDVGVAGIFLSANGKGDQRVIFRGRWLWVLDVVLGERATARRLDRLRHSTSMQRCWRSTL